MDKSQKILIADDSAFMRKMLRSLLEEAGYKNCIEAENGKDAVSKVQSEKPGLVMMDIIMPEMGGIDAMKQIGTSAKVIVVSAVGQDAMVKEATAAGAIGYINKPFDKTAVLDAVSKA